MRPWLGEVEQVLPDGTSRQLEVSVTPVREADGSVSAYRHHHARCDAPEGRGE